MKKQLIASLGVVCLLSAGVFAGEGIPANILDDMGLSGIEILTDGDALAVRGLGVPKMRPKSSVSVGGRSHASIPGIQPQPTILNGNGGGSGTANSSNWYRANGTYFAAGGNESHASRTTTDTKIRRYNGHRAVHKTIHKVEVRAGGYSWGAAF
ncbi:MAG TPA: hypothetical protein VMX74_11650 [Pirellulales bacterium]|nr:hypothetical protein [Pirellulales bacterium]